MAWESPAAAVPTLRSLVSGVSRVDPDQVTVPLNIQRFSMEMAAEAVDKANAGVDQLATLLAADVGHTDSEVVYEENKLELNRYEPDEKRHETPIFIVYALVNRPYILDLQPDRSVVRRLLEAGFVVYMIDWGEPSRLDCALTMADYVNRYIDNCVDAACEDAGVDDVHLLGYCMGGTMSIMYTATHQERVRTMTLLTTPFAFDGDGGILERLATHFDPDATVDALGNLPAELLAIEFSLLDPVENYVAKFVRLYENIEDDEFVENFSRMEQWIWDGVDIAGEAYREFINDVYKDNQLARGEYHLGDERIDPGDIEVPLQQIVGEYDHLVPPESSKPVNDAIGSDDERLIEFSAGHIGVSVSTSAQDELWPDVASWLADRSVEADSEETDAEGTPATAEQTRSVLAISGIGPTYADRLEEAGIETVADLRSYDPQLIAAVTDAPQSRAADWLDQGS
jgi:polyhydroxyalkanoate synthase